MVVESLDMTYAYAQAVREALTEVDVLASPTVPIAAPEIGVKMETIGGQQLPLQAVAIANTAPYNIAHVPAISLPCCNDQHGLADRLPDRRPSFRRNDRPADRPRLRAERGHAMTAGLHIEDRPDDEPAFVLMQGFPDDSHIYDSLVPLLAPRRMLNPAAVFVHDRPLDVREVVVTCRFCSRGSVRRPCGQRSGRSRPSGSIPYPDCKP